MVKLRREDIAAIAWIMGYDRRKVGVVEFTRIKSWIRLSRPAEYVEVEEKLSSVQNGEKESVPVQTSYWKTLDDCLLGEGESVDDIRKAEIERWGLNDKSKDIIRIYLPRLDKNGALR